MLVLWLVVMLLLLRQQHKMYLRLYTHEKHNKQTKWKHKTKHAETNEPRSAGKHGKAWSTRRWSAVCGCTVRRRPGQRRWWSCDSVCVCVFVFSMFRGKDSERNAIKLKNTKAKHTYSAPALLPSTPEASSISAELLPLLCGCRSV